MANQNTKVTKGVSHNTSTVDQNEVRRAKKKAERHGRSKRVDTSQTYYFGNQQDQREERRQRFVSRLETIVVNARLVADELGYSAPVREIMELVIQKFYTLSIASTSDKQARFEEAQKAIMAELQKADSSRTPGFLSFASNRGLDALMGGYAIGVNGINFEETVAGIKRRIEQRRPVRSQTTSSTPVRELVSA